MSVCLMSVSQDLAQDCWADMVHLYSQACYKSREGLNLFWVMEPSPSQDISLTPSICVNNFEHLYL